MSSYVFLIFLLLLFLVAVFSIIVNLITHYPLTANIKWLIVIFLGGLGFYLLSVNRYLELFKSFIFFSILIFVVWPSWLHGGGDNAITMLYMLLLSVLALIMVDNPFVKWSLVALTALSCIAFLIITYKMPHLVQPNQGQDVFADSIFQVAMIFSVTGLSVQAFMSRHKRQQNQMEALNKSLEYLATVDVLSQVLNRRAILDFLDAKIAEANGPVFVTMLDIDHFKQINDLYGHQVGDRVIRLFADYLKAVAEKDGVVGRYGGDEFLVILGGIDEDGARRIATRFLEIPPCEGIDLTTSAGMAKVSSGQNADGVIGAADSLLFESKRRGRSRITLFDGSTRCLAEEGGNAVREKT